MARFYYLCFIPLVIFALAFLALPLARLLAASVNGEAGFMIYWDILTNQRYMRSLLDTVIASALVTLTALFISTTAALFLSRHNFTGKAVLVSLLTFPLAFPGVVIGFLIILLGGRQGLTNEITRELFGMRVVFAYTIVGLFLGYLYFSIPRVLLTVMAAVEKLDPDLEEAARSLGARPFAVLRDVTLPGLAPALFATGAMAFATAMGAFGTAFTLATNIDVLPMVIYTEFTLSANIAMACALSVILGLVTWALLLISRSFSGTTVAAAG